MIFLSINLKLSLSYQLDTSSFKDNKPIWSTEFEPFSFNRQEPIRQFSQEDESNQNQNNNITKSSDSTLINNNYNNQDLGWRKFMLSEKYSPIDPSVSTFGSNNELARTSSNLDINSSSAPLIQSLPNSYLIPNSIPFNQMQLTANRGSQLNLPYGVQNRPDNIGLLSRAFWVNAIKSSKRRANQREGAETRLDSMGDQGDDNTSNGFELGNTKIKALRFRAPTSSNIILDPQSMVESRILPRIVVDPDTMMDSNTDNIHSGSHSMHSFYHPTYPAYFGGHKIAVMPRKSEKSLATPILVGIASALLSFLILSNVFLAFPLLAMAFMQFFNNNNNMVLPPYNPPNGNNQNNNNPNVSIGRRRKRQAHEYYFEPIVQRAINLKY